VKLGYKQIDRWKFSLRIDEVLNLIHKIKKNISTKYIPFKFFSLEKDIPDRV